MNCEAYQRNLLLAANPAGPPADVALHLADCPNCREWQRRLAHIEHQVALLPVPVSDGKARLLQRILSGPFPLPSSPASPLKPAWRRIAFFLGGAVAAAVLIAAGILVGGLASRSLQGPGNEPQAQAPGKLLQPSQAGAAEALPGQAAPIAGTLVDRLMECDLRLAQAESTRQRVETLAELADALRDEAQALGKTAAPEALEALALFYSKVVREGVIQRARALPPEQRREVLVPIAARLDRATRDVEEIARKAAPASAERLRLVASIAREGDVQLRALAREGAP
jgi:hypothetical protein